MANTGTTAVTVNFTLTDLAGNVLGTTSQNLSANFTASTGTGRNRACGLLEVSTMTADGLDMETLKGKVCAV